MSKHELSERTLAAIEWCDIYAIAFAEFADGSVEFSIAKTYAPKRWMQYRELDPISVAQRDWRALTINSAEQG